jgi:MoxR-like ATPase
MTTAPEPAAAADTALLEALRASVEQVIRGKPETIRLVIAALLAEGHVLLEDVPGVGKSTLAQALARSLDVGYRRIQFTPDLLPADVTGVSVYDRDEKAFVFQPGPVFASVVLADEINRTTPRTQSALLEAMNVGQVTVDGVTHALPRPFMVIATQNPLEFTGTYPLPESQLDRFLMRLRLRHPDREAERRLLLDRKEADPLAQVRPAASAADVARLCRAVRAVAVSEPVLDYLQAILAASREDGRLALGASPRAGLALFRTAQAVALLEGRDYVLPDDVKSLALPVLGHRLVTREESRLGRVGSGGDAVIEDLLETVTVPL